MTKGERGKKAVCGVLETKLGSVFKEHCGIC